MVVSESIVYIHYKHSGIYVPKSGPLANLTGWKKSLPPAQIALENMQRLEGILEEQFRKKLAWLIYKACLAGPLNYIPEQL